MGPSNLEYSKESHFEDICKKANIVATSRQASKFRMRKGAAFKRVVMKDSRVHIPIFAKINQDEI